MSPSSLLLSNASQMRAFIVAYFAVLGSAIALASAVESIKTRETRACPPADFTHLTLYPAKSEKLNPAPLLELRWCTGYAPQASDFPQRPGQCLYPLPLASYRQNRHLQIQSFIVGGADQQGTYIEFDVRYIYKGPSIPFMIVESAVIADIPFFDEPIKYVIDIGGVPRPHYTGPISD
ncbi:uncharacterized protein L969DRAFT_19981 [Mixia osmundae IAM 14324]|uniref:uncharacterized protein n=1 Tax=Mixia osmundae (strain CBS 9802 / IAM 14324 / JCM 22182 / KY 12970) TaxID=764103 RepID=UPI0004A54A3F|nr:uncharacterized protein L969DRAFT_19981 [Mixia osmundae IAM 14324]KEI36589.1 hypothetical protein L969DRAFT_19981 [Mixia osmundae IAM 14324]